MTFIWQQNLLYLNIYKYYTGLVFPKIYSGAPVSSETKDSPKNSCEL